MRKFVLASFAALSLAAVAAPASAMPLITAVDTGVAGAGVTAPVVPVAEGCGWGRWRGPWGHCRDTPYVGPLPGGGYQPGPPVIMGNGCPPGYWRGPWGHCRDTPYHGRLPGGGWQ
ncbi:hypothetical protein GCM10007301_25140 [Azorhizobium oxalatiphilum]|uniref:Uncharacterized protein n=1 Tax=Azorhizobium oxalatiphilum TaxID=980631 RepID=A0A917BZE3_9HYPH|nr:hypothetical protein [Azorhizobium oxalatiphilum]GGF64291.1 hypothetical protein GCM10007301_25140 [Azorhizobium oxalatiphilum]